MAVDEDHVPAFVRKLRAQRERHGERSRLVRVLLVLVGFTVLLAGLAMLVTPGPAFVIIPIGLAILSLEFVWAERLLDRSLIEAEKAKQKAAETSGTQRVLAALATAAAVAAVVVWGAWGDIPVVPV